ncbi:MAG: PDZ domain-containing protein [Flavobacteriales bacterium]|nr:PDZ domain-containing protein [Flavobacteriales bacterium]
MIRYFVYTTHPHRHFISFEAWFPTCGKEKIKLQLPAWRPGRYELGNFAKNIRGWNAVDDLNNKLPFRKLTKDQWEVDAQGLEEICIRYQYYAAVLNAGSSYLDEEQLYINPVNCFFYLPEHHDEPYEVRLDIPHYYKLACALPAGDRHHLTAKNFDELADSPLIASEKLEHFTYKVSDKTFHIWVNGENALDGNKLLFEFEAFTQMQMDVFGSIPCTEYHFLFQLIPNPVRHGVEHSASTVIALGPSADLVTEKLYNELLGISCHELFHTWNIKNIRPVEMMPYNFTRENYSRLGYVYEGVTTYYGDLLLLRSGVWSEMKWLEAFAAEVNMHFHNPGRFNHSVADSSFDTWLDGYVPGIPGRKVSIYTEGALIAFICDILILRASGNECSLDNVMRLMYECFGKKGGGYSEEDYQKLLEEVSGISFKGIFKNLVHEANTYFDALTDALQFIGLELDVVESQICSETFYGFTTDEKDGRVHITTVDENSPADIARLWVGDEILSVCGVSVSKGLQNLLESNRHREVELLVYKKMKLSKRKILATQMKYCRSYRIVARSKRSPEQELNWEKFSGRRMK